MPEDSRMAAAVRAADVVVVISGTDGALPSVVAGLVESPVIAVPTSVGYGAALQVSKSTVAETVQTSQCQQCPTACVPRRPSSGGPLCESAGSCCTV